MDKLGIDHDWSTFRAAYPDLFSSPKAFLEHWYPVGAAFLAEAKQHFQLPA